MNKNFIDKLFIQSIDVMKTDSWQWPDKWNEERKIKFLDDSLSYAEQNEMYEQCAIIRDVKETFKNK